MGNNGFHTSNKEYLCTECGGTIATYSNYFCGASYQRTPERYHEDCVPASWLAWDIRKRLKAAGVFSDEEINLHLVHRMEQHGWTLIQDGWHKRWPNTPWMVWVRDRATDQGNVYPLRRQAP